MLLSIHCLVKKFRSTLSRKRSRSFNLGSGCLLILKDIICYSGYSYQYSVVKYRILALQVESIIPFSSLLNSWKPSSGLVKINCDVSPSDELLKILALDVHSVSVASGQVSLHRFLTNSLFPASPTYCINQSSRPFLI